MITECVEERVKCDVGQGWTVDSTRSSIIQRKGLYRLQQFETLAGTTRWTCVYATNLAMNYGCDTFDNGDNETLASSEAGSYV